MNDVRPVPWTFLALAAVALAIQFAGAGAVYGLGWFFVQSLTERAPQLSRSSSQAI